jgi:hypothetical protein
MKRINYICILIVIYIICSARSCMEDPEIVAKREHEFIFNLKDSIENVFMSDSFPDQLLKAYEITAAEKLYDFADYLKIISDTTLDFIFRQQAAELVRDLFISDEIELRTWSNVYPVAGLNTLELLLTRSLAEGMTCWIQPVQINVSTPFVRENDSTFTGILSFYQNCISFNNPDTSENISEMLFIDMYILKRIKSFGTEQIRVWEVYLGDNDQVY